MACPGRASSNTSSVRAPQPAAPSAPAQPVGPGASSSTQPWPAAGALCRRRPRLRTTASSCK
eukprot:1316439-Lingulodinium_polyedra.AAC.1